MISKDLLNKLYGGDPKQYEVLMDKPPQIELTPQRIICGRHGEIFKANWPVGYAWFVTIGMEALVCDKTFAALVKQAIEDTGVVKEEAVNFLLKIKPLCCHLTPADLLKYFFRSIAKPTHGTAMFAAYAVALAMVPSTASSPRPPLAALT